jgi:hypothetical protein
MRRLRITTMLFTKLNLFSESFRIATTRETLYQGTGPGSVTKGIFVVSSIGSPSYVSKKCLSIIL